MLPWLRFWLWMTQAAWSIIHGTCSTRDCFHFLLVCLCIMSLFNRKWTVSMCSAFLSFGSATIFLLARKSCNWIIFVATGFRIIGLSFSTLYYFFQTIRPFLSYLLTIWLLFQGHQFSCLWKWECFGFFDSFRGSVTNH